MKMTIGQRIAEARMRAGLNQSQLAAQLDVAPQSVQQWERDKTTPRRNRIESLANCLGVAPEWILFGNSPLNSNTVKPAGIKEVETTYKVNHVVTSAKNLDIVCVPVLNSAAELTAEDEVEMDQAGTEITLGKDLLMQYGLSEESSAAITVSNDEMAPRIRKGDTLLIDLTNKRAADGAIFAVAVGNQIKIRRLIAQLNGSWLITCDNVNAHDCREETLSDEAFFNLNILGRVLMVMGAI
ncbi:XRE family transcriptional regulator [Pontibacterium sp.]|uniref:XRE family transcriptional regulator n=1 Tax=Pontibacterium sp. TaxID=2036026 RepID=UPI0035184B2D